MLESFFVTGFDLINPFHDAHFDNTSPSVLATIDQLNTAIATQFAQVPLVSGSGAFAYDENGELVTESFGPIFAERSLTAGKGHYSFSFNILRRTFDTFDGIDLEGGDFAVNLTHTDLPLSEDPSGTVGTLLDPFYEGDVIAVQTAIELEQDTFLIYGNFGVTNRLDLAFGIPLVEARLDAQFTSTINRFATGSPGIHDFETGDTFITRMEDSATGIGDVIVRGKYNFTRKDHIRSAITLEGRLPTGDEDDLLGIGAAIGKAQILVDGDLGGRFMPHLNVGYSFAFDDSDLFGDIPDEANATVGFDMPVLPVFTFAFDIITRTIFSAGRVEVAEEEFLYVTADDQATVRSAELPSITPAEGDLTQVLGSVGFKWNPGSTVLLTVGTLFSFEDDTGLQDDFSVVGGLEYHF